MDRLCSSSRKKADAIKPPRRPVLFGHSRDEFAQLDWLGQAALVTGGESAILILVLGVTPVRFLTSDL